MNTIKIFVLAILFITCCTQISHADIMINEIAVYLPGLDPEYQDLELKGKPGEAFSGKLVVVNNTASTNGQIDYVENVLGNFNANGLLHIEIRDIPDPSFTVLLVDAFDNQNAPKQFSLADNLSIYGITTIYDAVGITKSHNDEKLLMGEALGGSNFSYQTDNEYRPIPTYIFRDGHTDKWYSRVNSLYHPTTIFDSDNNMIGTTPFNHDPITDTFGYTNPSTTTVNPTIPNPEPSTFAMVGLCGLASLIRRKK